MSGSPRLFPSFPSCSRSSDFFVSCSCCHRACPSLWDLRRLRQHCASHLSDRCLLPKQWVIGVLHLSGSTHLARAAAFLLLLLVMDWHPQSAYPAPFVSAWHADALSLSGSGSVYLPLFLHSSLSLTLTLTKPLKSNGQADYLRKGKAKNRKKKEVKKLK